MKRLPPTEGAKIVSRPAETANSDPIVNQCTRIAPLQTQIASKPNNTEIGECIAIRDESSEDGTFTSPSSGPRSTNNQKSTRIPILRTPIISDTIIDKPFFASSSNTVPSSAAVLSAPSRLISGLRLKQSENQVLETEKTKELHSESCSSVAKDNSKTTEKNSEEDTEIITETISNARSSKAVEKKTKVVQRTDRSTTTDTNFLRTVVRKSRIEVVTETKIAENFFGGE